MYKNAPLDLITGGAGITGIHLAEELSRQGRRVRVLDLKRWPGFPPGTDAVMGDVRNKAVLRRALKGVSNVYHLATLIQHDRVSTGVFTSVIADGGEGVARLSAEAGVKSIVMFTTTEVYGHIPDGPASEDSPRRPLDAYGRAKKLLEDRIFALAREGAPVSIIRPTVIVGPCFPFATLPIIFTAFRRNLPLPIMGDGAFRVHFVHVRDVVSLAMAAAESPQAVGHAFNAGSGEVPSFRELMEALKKYIGSRSPLVPIPLRAALLFMRGLDRFVSPFCMEPGQFEIMGEDYLLDLSKARRLLAWEPDHTNLEAFRDAYDWHLCMHPYPKPRKLRPGLGRF